MHRGCSSHPITQHMSGGSYRRNTMAKAENVNSDKNASQSRCYFYAQNRKPVNPWQNPTSAPTTTGHRGHSLNPRNARSTPRRRTAASAVRRSISQLSFRMPCPRVSTTSFRCRRAGIHRTSRTSSLHTCGATGRSPTNS